MAPSLSSGLRVIFLDHKPFVTCTDWQEAEQMAFQLRQQHHARRVAVLKG